MNLIRLRIAFVNSVMLAASFSAVRGGDGGTEGNCGGLTRGDRYGEILLVRSNRGKLEAEVWGTQGLNDCPAASWNALDSKAIQSETGAFAVKLNGPRLWLPNTTTGTLASTQRGKFGDLEMRRLATVELELPRETPIENRPSLDAAAYTERIVRRNTTFVFNKGEEIYELTAPTGAVYVMQSMSQIVDPNLKLVELKDLASRLKLPTGWTYRVSSLDADCVLIAKGKAVVIQDDLRNTYQRR